MCELNAVHEFAVLDSAINVHDIARIGLLVVVIDINNGKGKVYCRQNAFSLQLHPSDELCMLAETWASSYTGIDWDDFLTKIKSTD